MPSSTSAPFNLRRYYAYVSFGFIFAIAVALGLITRHYSVSELMAIAEDRNQDVTATFRNSLWPQFQPFVARSYGLDPEHLRAFPDIPRLRQAVVSLMRDTNVAKIKIYNLQGVTVFSTDSRQIGEVKKGNAGMEGALAGKIRSELVHRATFDAFEGVLEDRDMFSSYLPIRNERNQVEAVFELYSDVTPFVQQLERTQMIVVLAVLVLLGVLYAALRAVVGRAHDIIQSQRESLEQANHVLDARVQERTRELMEANQALSGEIAERRRAEAAARALLVEKDAILDNISEGVLFTRNRVLLACNRRMEELFGYTNGELVGQNTALLYAFDQDYRRVGADAYQVMEQGLQYQTEMEFRRQDGTLFTGLLNGRAIDPRLPNDGSVWVINDITERKKTEERLRLTAKVFENSQEGVIITDADKRVVAVNQAFTYVTGYSEDEILGHKPRLLQSGRQDKAFYERMWQELNEAGQWKGELWNRRRNGEVYPEWLSISAVKNDRGVVSHYVGVFSDITEIKKSQEKVNFLAYHDPLTLLPNRLLFNDRLNGCIRRAKAEKKQFAVCFIDLDHFKNVNDSLGHHVGDQLLQLVASDMQAQLRKVDMVARQGGDEFIVLLEDLDGGPSAAATVAEKLLARFRRPILLERHEMYITASIGICIYPEDGEDLNTLIKNADAAMYRAKALGRNKFHFYSEDMTTHATERLELESALRRAVINDELILAYQPQIELVSHRLVGVEALVRWNHPQHGVLPPLKFIPLAEDTGLINQVGEWVLRTACRQMKAWRDSGFILPKIAVNISVKQLERQYFAQLVANILNECELEASCLELELTESVLMQTEEAFEVIEELERLGVQLSVDDFGTGYSSLSYLKRLPVHKLKIDRSFIMDLTHHGHNEAIVRAVIAMAKTLGLSAVAEGVESAEQAAFLRREGCDHAQGFLFGHPVEPEELVAAWKGAQAEALTP